MKTPELGEGQEKLRESERSDGDIHSSETLSSSKASSGSRKKNVRLRRALRRVVTWPEALFAIGFSVAIALITGILFV